MSVLIAGGSGFIGQHLTKYLRAQGHVVVILGRDKRKLKALFDDQVACLNWQELDDPQKLINIDIVINLAGENIAGRLWTEARKKQLFDSRLNTTRRLAHAFKKFNPKPSCFICASGVGIYPLGKVTYDENFEINQECTTTFLGKLALAWEKAAEAAEAMGIRVVSIRQGAVLGMTGGMLKSLIVFYRFGLGGRLGSGLQPFPWISLVDVVRAIDFIISHPHLTGPVNLVAPHLTDQATFAKTLTSALHRSASLVVPAWLLRLVFREMAEELFLTGARVAPTKLLESGFIFDCPHLKEAIERSLKTLDKNG